jgi:excisionase family DNA binding protein
MNETSMNTLSNSLTGTASNTGSNPAPGLGHAAPNPDDLMTPSDAARVLGLSADSVRVLSDSGRLPAMRTVSGRRLFRRADVDRLAADRAQQTAAAAAAKASGQDR